MEKMPTSRKICANFVIRSGRLKQIAPDLFFGKPYERTKPSANRAAVGRKPNHRPAPRKLHNIRQQRNAYPNDFKRDSFAADLHAQYGEIGKEELDPQGIPSKW